MAYTEQRIQELEALIARLRAQREQCVNEVTLLPTRSADGLRGIDQALAGAEQQLAFFRARP